MGTHLSLLYLFLVGLSSQVDAPSVATVTTVDVIEGGWGDAPPNEVHKVLISVIECMEKKTGVKLGVNLRVEPKGGPVLLSRKDPDGSYRIRLQTTDRHWGQLIYQFSHELGHLLARHNNIEGKHFWFDEAVCEAMSFQVLHLLSESWEQSPPFANLGNYSPMLSEYADQMASMCTPVKETDLPKWYVENRDALNQPEQNREVVRVISRHVASWLQEDNWLWKRIPDLGPSGEIAGAANGDSISFRIRCWINDGDQDLQSLRDRILRCFSEG